MTEQNFPLSGGCACGAVRYELTAPPLALIECHCTDCQTLTGSAFSLGMPVLKDTLKITKGAVKRWLRTGSSGNQIPQCICEACGVRLFTEPPIDAPTYTLRAGTLDETAWLKPVAAIWTDSAQAGQSFDHFELTYPGAPPGFDDILAAWRRAHPR